jgi:hypothetical protein
MKNTFYNFNIFKYKKSLIGLFIFIALSNVFAYYFKRYPFDFAKFYYRAIGRDTFVLRQKTIKIPFECFDSKDLHGDMLVGFFCVFSEKKYYDVVISKSMQKTDAEFEKLKPLTFFYEKKEHYIHYKAKYMDGSNETFDVYAIPELGVNVSADTPELAMTFVDLLLNEFPKGFLKDKEIQTK